LAPVGDDGAPPGPDDVPGGVVPPSSAPLSKLAGGRCIGAVDSLHPSTHIAKRFLAYMYCPELLEKIPVKKFCTPEEIAHTVEYLISPLAGFVTVRYSLLRFSLSPNQHVHLCGLVAPVALEISFSLAYMYTNHAMRCYSCGTG
jgi:hypothetical protein